MQSVPLGFDHIEADLSETSLYPALDHAFDLIVFDWDGTAVASRQDDASEVRELIEELLRQGVRIAIVTGTNLSHLEKQLLGSLRSPALHRLFVSTNRGSEGWIFAKGACPLSTMRRIASREEERALTEAAMAFAEALEKRGNLEVAVIHDRMNRRKIDLIPEPAWADPPKSELPGLVSEVEARLYRAGIEGGLREVVELARNAAHERGLADPRVTTDAKHVEIGLTDKGDALRWILREAPPRGASVLVIGDELGPLGGVPGSDSLMMIPEAKGATFVSVGPEPSGVPSEVIRLGGGPLTFRALLAHQLSLRQKRKTSSESAPEAPLPLRLTEDPLWTVVERGFELAREHEIEALFSLANGHAGVRGSLSEGSSLSVPFTLVAGLFANSPFSQIPQLVAAPDAMQLRLRIDGHELSLERLGGANFRALDLRQAALFREWTPRSPDGRVTRISEVKLASLAERDLLVQALAIVPVNYSGILELELSTMLPSKAPELQRQPGLTLAHFEILGPEGLLLDFRAEGAPSPLSLASSTFLTSERGEPLPRVVERVEGGIVERFIAPLSIGQAWILSRIICLQTQRDATDPVIAASARIRSFDSIGGRELMLAHREAWKERWDIADIVIEGNERAQRALRFAAYHLISAADPDDPRVSIGARGLSGTAYAGHVFWDTDIFMLPFFTLTHPQSARALLGYRHATLPRARERARSFGYEGALFAWESAATGEDVTPRYAIGPDGELVAIRAGELQHHISADVAYAVWSYWQSTEDRDFFIDEGAEILVETARFWASRGKLDADGDFHIDNVIGPDEYHVGVSDNAFTNGLARFNLLRAASAVDLLRNELGPRGRGKLEALAIADSEPAAWRKLADAMYLPIDPRTSVIEQFRGYFELDDIDLRAVHIDPTIPIDVVLGRERVGKAKIAKQADVLMLLYLLRDEFPRDIVLANFRYYEPRTAHGSSLSPGIHAALAARLGLVELAERYFEETAAIDLDDLMGNAASGVHMAALGSLWQATIFGCAGLSVGEDGILLDPHLLPSFQSIEFSMLHRKARLRIRIREEPSCIEVEASGEHPVRVGVRGGPSTIVEEGRRKATTKSEQGFGAWEEA